MQAKALEVRDRDTFIAVLAVDMNPSAAGDTWAHQHQQYLLRRCGYPCDGRPNIILTRLDGSGTATNDPYYWPENPRTMQQAHFWIIGNWWGLKDGDVVDVEWICGETDAPKKSERETVSLEQKQSAS